MIERIYRLPEGVVGLRATGEVTKEDYQRIVEPQVAALAAHHEGLGVVEGDVQALAGTADDLQEGSGQPIIRG